MSVPPLAEFAKQIGEPVKGKPCSTCALPQADEINAAKRDGTASVPQMYAWLHELGHVHITLPMLRNHFSSGHHA